MNALLIAALALCPPLPAAAKPRKPSAAAARSSRELRERVLEGLRAADASLNSLSFDFTQTLKMTESGLEQSTRGRLRYLKPDRVRIDYELPRVQHAYSDKKTIWVHTPADNSVVRGDWENWKSAQSGLSHLFDFGDYARLIDKHRVEVSSFSVAGSTVPYYRLDLSPKEDRGGASAYGLRLTLDGQHFLPRRTELSVERSVYRVEIESVQRNPEIEDKTFSFAIPKGAAVIDFPGIGR